MGRFHRDRIPGQDSKATERQALLESHVSARRNLVVQCSRVADRSKERQRIMVDRGGSDHPEHFAAPDLLRPVYRCEGQAAREQLMLILLLSL